MCPPVTGPHLGRQRRHGSPVPAKCWATAPFWILQKEIQSFVSQKADYAQRGFFPPIERLHTHQSLDAKENIVAQFSTLTYKNLQSVLEKNSEESIHAAADLLCSCRIKYIAGRRPTAPIAEKFSFLMRMVVPGVVSATGSVTFEQLLDISPEDCLFVINFNPYGEEVRRWIDLAHSRGAKIILLTDKPSTPFSDFTDVLLLADIYSVSFFNSNVSATFLLELLVSLVADQMDETRHQSAGSFEPLLRAEQALIFSYGISSRTEGGLNMLTPLKKEERQHEKSTLSCPCTGALHGAVQRLRH